jgi:hypothetical protein
VPNLYIQGLRSNVSMQAGTCAQTCIPSSLSTFVSTCHLYHVRASYAWRALCGSLAYGPSQHQCKKSPSLGPCSQAKKRLHQSKACSKAQSGEHGSRRMCRQGDLMNLMSHMNLMHMNLMYLYLMSLMSHM